MRGSCVAAATIAVACGSPPKGVEPSATNTGGAPVATAAKPLSVWPMDGPYASLEALCAPQIAKAEAEVPGEEAPCRDHADPRELDAPYRGARVVAVGSYERTCHLVVEMADDRWYRQTLGLCDASDNRSSQRLTVIELAAADLLEGGAAEVRLRYQSAEVYTNMDNDGLHSETTAELHLVCGVGGSGLPSCVDPFGVEGSSLVEWLDNDQVDPELAAERPPPGRDAWRREVTYQPDAIVLGEPGKTGDDRTGRHPIVFP